jgi:nitrogen fixation-related uncharacterized protein
VSALLFVGGLLLLSGTAGLLWAVRTGQHRHLDDGARSIFDDSEPIGQRTDRFPPGKEPKNRP